MVETETLPDTRLELRQLCECEIPSFFHAPYECPNDGDETCAKCGKQVCGNCTGNHEPTLCLTCLTEVSYG